MAVNRHAGGSPRAFGLTFAGVSTLVALHRWWRGHGDAAAAFALGAAVLCAIAWARPQLLDRPNRLWMRLARALGWVNSRILLSLLFFVVITPYGVLQRLAGRDRLGQRWRHAPPGWLRVPRRLADPKHYDHLY